MRIYIIMAPTRKRQTKRLRRHTKRTGHTKRSGRQTKKKTFSKKKHGGGIVNMINGLILYLLTKPFKNTKEIHTIIRTIREHLTKYTGNDKNAIDMALIKLEKYNLSKFNNNKYELLIPFIQDLLDKCSHAQENEVQPSVRHSVQPRLLSPAKQTNAQIPLKTNRTTITLPSRKTDDFFDFKDELRDNINNYKSVATLIDGNCFYSAYYRLAHIFKSNANLTIFKECSNKIVDEQGWIECFKQGFCNGIATEEDPILTNIVDNIFDNIFDNSFKSYITSDETALTGKRVTYFDNLVTSYGSMEQLWIKAFTEKLHEQLDNFNHDLLMLNGYEDLLNSDDSMVDANLDIFYLNSSFFNENIKSVVKSAFIEGLNDKNCASNNQWVTQLEIDIITNYINARAKTDKNIIPIASPPIISDSNKAQLLNKNKDKLQFMFYYTSQGGNAQGIENHYEGLFSQSALDAHFKRIINKY
jgi:hypothetical protein